VPKVKKNSAAANATSSNVGYETELWQMADALRGSMDAAEYKHVVLGLIFLKYISDAFEELHGNLVAEKAQGADPEDPDEYRGAAHSVFWVPPEARWASASDHEAGPKFLRITDIVSGHIDWNAVPHVPADPETTAKYRLHDGDVVLARTGASTGASAYVKNPPLAVFASYLVRLQAKPEFDPRFLAYYLRSEDFWTFIRGVLGDKSAQPNASASTMTKAPLRAPKDKDEQRAIAHILGTLDDKIELNRRMNETLEAIVRALFKSWFVGFDPVRAKAEGREPGLPYPLVDLFPDSFEDSALGEIPKGWAALPLYEVATYINGAAYTAFQPNDERRGLPIIKIAELKAGVTPQTKFSDVQMPEKYRISHGDILFSWSGNPDTSIDTFVWPQDPAWLNQHIFRVVPHHQVERAFVLSTLKHLRPVFAEIARNKQTTGLGHVTAADMKRLLVARPDDRVMQAWSVIAAPLLGRAFQTAVENRSLSTLRDTLLARLISGELRVTDVERFAARVDA
jgi:type I restriction enzyme, S subunit